MIDLPLRDPVPPGEAAADPMPIRDTAAADEPGPRSSGSGMIAVGMLAIGLLAGFGGGFLVGQRMAPPVSPFAEVPRPVQPPSPPVGADLPPSRDASADRRSLGEGRQVGPGAVQAPSNVPAMPVGTDAGAVPAAVAPAAVIEEPVVPPAPPAPVAGTLQFDSRPNGATIYLDDVRVGVTPMTMNNVRPGMYGIRMELFGHDTWVTTVDVVAGERRRVGASL